MSVVSPERYWQELVDIHNPGVLEVLLGINEQCYSALGLLEAGLQDSKKEYSTG